MPARMRWGPAIHERIRREELRDPTLRLEAKTAVLSGHSFAAFRIRTKRGVAEVIYWGNEDSASVAANGQILHVGSMPDIWAVDRFVTEYQELVFG